MSFVTGLEIESLCADLTTFVPGRKLDDDANVLLRLANGAKGTLTCSQIACGEENNLTLRVYGTRGGIEWHQQSPNSLIFKPAGAPSQVLRVGQGYLSDAAKAATRVPPGHPEGYLEAFATIYSAAIADMRRRREGQPTLGGYPTVHDGVRGMRFIDAVVQSSQRDGAWLKV
jgi:predicted dehydrogenase